VTIYAPKEKRFIQSTTGALGFGGGMLNILLTLFHHLHPDADPFQMCIAKFSL